MNTTFEVLQVTAVLKYIRPLPYYLGIDCNLEITAFVNGDSPVEKELSDLETFRKTVILLAEEGLDRPANCKAIEEPFVGIKLTAGGEDQESIYDFHLSLGWEPRKNANLWVLRWGKENEDHQFLCAELRPALALMKNLLDLKTAQWASQVVFRPSSADS